MSKYTASGVERELQSKIAGFKSRVTAIKKAYTAKRQDILRDERLTDAAKTADLAKLSEKTAEQIASIKGEQEAYISTLRSNVESALRGSQPTDANSVLLRRDAADRARKIIDEVEALDVLSDAIRGGDVTLQHAVAHIGRQKGWVEVTDAYRAAQPASAAAAAALAVVEGLDRDTGFNLANQITFAAPLG
ncbi:hypothetical protein [Microbacterium hominis]|uniref:hypothetical protein n=1 Tax=Microbacterium hominis TaxID=162426 RepID=UPI000768521A|nr:hypothetical protein [Microbacterium hominis]KXC06428.1 hypothetical protein MhomT_05695 [Microbacterium hominis]